MLTALLDTSVLWPGLQRDFLLTLAIEGAHRPIWSSAILEELLEHESLKLQRRGTPQHEADEHTERLIGQMRHAFPDAEAQHWEAMEGTFGLPDPDDEHVLAVAVVGNAGAIVTANLKDFPATRLPATIEALSPAAFVLNTVTLDPVRALSAVAAIAARSGRHAATWTVTDVLDLLAARYGMDAAVAVLQGVRHRGPTSPAS